MKENLTWLIFVIDRSGSMSSIATDMVGGFNEFIKKQRKVPGICRAFAYQFDDVYEPIFEDIDINDVPDLGKSYSPRGSTALYDSLGKTIADIGRKLSEMKEEDRPEKVLVVTITDGYNNSHLMNFKDVIYPLETLREVISRQTNAYNWDFVYIGANQDSWTAGEAMGIAGSTKLNYVASSVGVSQMFGTLGDATSLYRSTKGAKFAFKAADAAGKTDEDEDDKNS